MPNNAMLRKLRRYNQAGGLPIGGPAYFPSGRATLEAEVDYRRERLEDSLLQIMAERADVAPADLPAAALHCSAAALALIPEMPAEEA